ncbi:hypothetical protein V8E55_005947 [Tylopilus felleus]
MSNSDTNTPLLKKSHAPRPSSRKWNTVMVIALQSVPLPDILARWVNENPSETNLLLTMSSTAFGWIGSCLLGITVARALTSRLSRARLNLSIMTAWIQLASTSVIPPNRHTLWWTFISGLWLVAIRFLTTAWSNLLTPESIVLQFPVNGSEPSFLVPAVSNYTFSVLNVPKINPTAPKYSLTLGSLPKMASTIGYYSQAGRSAAMGIIDPKLATFTEAFNSSTGGALFVMDNNIRPQLLSLPPPEIPKGLSTTYTLWQQGYTARILCNSSSSPTINLNGSSITGSNPVDTPIGSFTYGLQTWSWTANCSSNAQYYTGDVNILTGITTSFSAQAWTFLPFSSGLAARSESSTGRGLFATSVCFFQNLSGPSNQSFLVLMESPSDNYTQYYSLPIVCEVTPMVTTVEVQYDQSGTANVNSVQPGAPLPDDCWPLALGEGFVIWAVYFLAQGMYANSLADDIISLWQPMTNDSLTTDQNATRILEQYLRGMFEYTGTVMPLSHPPACADNLHQTIRNAVATSLTSHSQPLLRNMTVPFNGIMKVQTMGWTFHPKTHGAALGLITLVTVVTVGFGVFALMEPNNQKSVPTTTSVGDSYQKGSIQVPVFDPTNLMDVLVASSRGPGSLSDALLHCKTEEDRDRLKVGITLTDKGHELDTS